MDQEETTISQVLTSAEKVSCHQDVKTLWDRWDKAQQEGSPSELVKGFNLVGVGLIIAGAMFQSFGTGLLKNPIAPLVVLAGAVIVAVKKFKSLWQQRS